jgi:hypothetical protein
MLGQVNGARQRRAVLYAHKLRGRLAEELSKPDELRLCYADDNCSTNSLASVCLRIGVDDVVGLDALLKCYGRTDSDQCNTVLCLCSESTVIGGPCDVACCVLGKLEVWNSRLTGAPVTKGGHGPWKMAKSAPPTRSRNILTLLLL